MFHGEANNGEANKSYWKAITYRSHPQRSTNNREERKKGESKAAFHCCDPGPRTGQANRSFKDAPYTREAQA
ncbi:hypothetical protein RHGRI_015423 [Rhododendron griersonianum]|uniref:Uncharacterized protein n=1 Tax=Rhododendron griersonianum TaxID=479676 RepID=A0AAV6KE31_9ERIC|nr:hypothetical protein RHGRI_015423 [Rhododendron griersonianum]